MSNPATSSNPAKLWKHHWSTSLEVLGMIGFLNRCQTISISYAFTVNYIMVFLYVCPQERRSCEESGSAVYQLIKKNEIKY